MNYYSEHQVKKGLTTGAIALVIVLGIGLAMTGLMVYFDIPL